MISRFGRADGGRLRVRPGAVLTAAGLALWMLWGHPAGGARFLAVTAAAAALHEAGHATAAGLCGIRLRRLTLDIFGARLEAEGMLTYGQEFVLAAGGPAVNLLTAAAVMPLWTAHGCPGAGWLYGILTASLGLAAVNLLPVQTLDGGRMLYCLTASVWPSRDPAASERAARRVLTAAGIAVVGGLWLLSVYALLRGGQLLSLFVFSFCLLVRAVGEG